MKPIKVLVLGNYSPLTLSLISRLDKEGNTIFVITGNDRKTGSKPKGVFQEYNFSCDSDKMNHIIENIEADIAIFGGSMDNLYDLENQPKHISKYLSGITNIVLSLKNSTVRQFIYVSNLSVFSGNTELVIDENTEPNPRGNIEKTKLVGEYICKNYDKERNFKVTVLRFCEIYGTYEDYYLESNICTRICRQVITNQEVEIIKNKRHNIIDIDDSVEAIIKVMDKNNKNAELYELYHVATRFEETYYEEDILNILKSRIVREDREKVKIKIIEDAGDIIDQEYNIDKIKTLNFKTKYSLKDKIDGIYIAVAKSIEQDIENSKKISFLARLLKIDGRVKNKILPFIENLAFFSLLNIFIYFTKSMDFHLVVDVYMLYVVMIGLIYGFGQTIFSIILSVIFKTYTAYSWGIGNVALTDYYMYLWTLELFTIGVSVGYIKEQYKLKILDVKDENDHLQLELAEVSDINRGNEEIKSLYEKRLLNYKDSFGRIYEIISEIDTIEPQAIMFKSIQVVKRIMNTEDVSIYMTTAHSSFFRLMACSSEKSKKLKASLKVLDHPKVFEKLNNKEVYINSSLDPNLPIMAGGTYKDRDLKSIIMVWSLPFENNNLYQRNVFGVLCKLIERSLTIAYEYMDNISKSYNGKADNILGKEAFEKILEIYNIGLEQGIAEFFLMRVKKSIDMSNDEFTEILRKNVRETDYIGEDTLDTMKVLLANTNEEESVYVRNRLESNGIVVEKGEQVE